MSEQRELVKLLEDALLHYNSQCTSQINSETLLQWVQSLQYENFKPASPELIEQIRQSDKGTKDPEWGENQPDQISQYYASYEENVFDYFLRWAASYLKVVLHGNIDQEQLASSLASFDIKKLLLHGPYENSVLSFEAQKLIRESLSETENIIDIHLHLLGLDEGNFIHPRTAAQGIAPLMDYFKFSVLRYAAGITSPIGSTAQARLRLQLYVASFPKLIGMLLPIHGVVLQDGTLDWENTSVFLRNHPSLKSCLSFFNAESELLPAISVHPFHPYWKQKLQEAREKGICLIKWMPPQGIPPDSEYLDAYYRLVRELGMTLIAHAGPEHTIPANKDHLEWQDWGNPLRFRRALEKGVNVILAHCGHQDKIPDLDDPLHKEISGYQLFIRLAKEAHEKNKSGEWEGRLFGDLSAVTSHYGSDFVRTLLELANQEGIRLIYGSDYPLTNLIQPNYDAFDALAEKGLLASQKSKPLKEIRTWNPLLANYVFTKNLEWQTSQGEKIVFPSSTFTGKFKDVDLMLIDRKRWDMYKIIQKRKAF